MPVMSEGIRSGVNWIRLKSRSRMSATVLIEQGLRQARHARDEAMAAGEQRDEHLLHHVVLADDHLPQLGEDALASLADPLRPGRRRLENSVHVSLRLNATTSGRLHSVNV